MRSHIFAAVSAAALVSSLTPMAAWSQDRLDFGAGVEDALTNQDSRSRGSGAYRYRDYVLQLREGQRAEAVLRSDDFDAMLALYAAGATGEPLVQDDDGLGSGTDSRLRFTAPSTGEYVLRVRTYSGLEGGAFNLSLAERPPAPRAPRPSRISVGQTLEGRLQAGDAEDDEDLYDAFSFRARAGQRFAVTLESEDFDALLRVGRATAGGFAELARNDDGPGRGLDSYLIFTAPEAGEYIIRAMSLGSDEGAYAVTLAEGPAPAPTTPINIGDSVDGTLSADSGPGGAGRPAVRYRFAGREGQRIAVSASSDDFDTYLELFDANENSLAQNDDGGDGTNSRLAHVLPSDGDYVIEVRDFSSGEGDFSLEIEELAPPKPPTPIAFGGAVEGELTDDDDVNDNGQRFDGYVFTAEAGQRIQAIVRSGDFDTVVQVGEGDADDFSVLSSDDDGLGEGTNSRLSFTVPEAGDYVLRVMGWQPSERGLYALELVDRGPEPTPGSILVGATARGGLSEADAMAEDGAYYDAYRFEAKAGEKIRFIMVSNAFDAMVQVGSGDSDEFEQLAADDDGLSDTHARLDWTAPDEGTYVIRARSYASGETGDYVLTVERQP